MPDTPKFLVGYEAPVPNTWNYFKNANDLFGNNAFKNIKKDTELYPWHRRVDEVRP